MFSGIVKEIGTVAAAKKHKGILELSVKAPKTAKKAAKTESVSVDGVCLTVVGKRGSRLKFDVIPETLKRTTLKLLCPGSRVNVEPALSVKDRFNGHIVLGHVDTTGKVAAKQSRAGEVALTVRFPAHFRRWLVPKGSIALNGVSLTLGKRMGKSSFSVYLIPETLRLTRLGWLSVGDKVNIEFDYLAKLASHMARR